MREIFNQADIEANRQSKLSAAQVELIKASANPNIWVWGSVICLVLVGVVYLLSDGFAGALGFLGWVMGLVLLFCAARWLMIWNLRRKLLNDPVAAADGTVTFKKLDALDTPRYCAETSDGARLLPQGLPGLSVMLPPGKYRFYYLPTRRWLLSSEPLSSEGELKANLIEVLGNILDFDPNILASLRAAAADGEVKMVDGQPNIETRSSDAQGEVYYESYAEIGGVKFQIPVEATYAIIRELHYRLYCYEDKPTDIGGSILSVNSSISIAGIEPL